MITYVAYERERDFRAFVLSRAARIYSVAIPTLMLVMLVDWSFIATGDPGSVNLYQYNGAWKYLPLSLFFLTDHGFLAENAFSHGGWWSVSYEVWYYVLFAAAFYVNGWKRWVAAGLVALIMGPKLLALLPCWLFGSFVFYLHKTREAAPRAPVPVFVLTLALVGASILFDGLHTVDAWVSHASDGWVTQNMRFSQWFAGDTLLAALFAINIYVAKYACLDFGRVTNSIRFVASFTFIFYMAHGQFISVGIKHLSLDIVLTALFAILGCFLLGWVTERQKDRLHRILADSLDGLLRFRAKLAFAATKSP